MGIENVPYVGSWKLNNRQVVKHTPDALVYLNGDLSLPGCPTCGGRIDIQPYLTNISVDPSVEGPATASFSLHVPRAMGDGLFRDGNFILRPGLEVSIYYRGYFPVKGMLGSLPAESTGGVDLRGSVMYPYYHVFHGVITEVNHEYSAGEHTATISCADLLHFWQYQRMSTNGSLFGARPTNSHVKMSLVGHNLTGMSPYAIIYTLFRDVVGAAGGAEFALGNKTNAAANSSVIGESLFSLSILYWQKRFSQTMTSLRMYGMDGTLYPAEQAVFLAGLSQSEAGNLARVFADRENQSDAKDVIALNALRRTADAVKFDGSSIVAGSSGGKNAKDVGVNGAQLQAFVSDIGNWGNVNLFESQYATKLEIANTVKEAAGYEFFMDVDGDIVFKPPFYNLDTSASRVYRIEEIDIISFSASEKEPEATVVKVTGSHFKNLKVPTIEGPFGTRAEFVDYRLVAQFGWRQQTFETSYHTDPAAMFYAAVARFDLFNIGIHSASLSIPIRPELRPGYPIYIVPLDCFYYVHSFSHQFQFGGQCTTAVNLVGRRAKFYAPGDPPNDGNPATIANIQLNNMHLPALPLSIVGRDGIPRLQGFPNVVMTLDPEQVNPLTFSRGSAVEDLQTPEAIHNLINKVLAARSSVLERDPSATTGSNEQQQASDGPWLITVEGGAKVPVNVDGLLQQAGLLRAVYDKNEATEEDFAKAEADAAALTALVLATRDIHERAFPADGSTAAYLELLADQKAMFNPGKSLPGYYRYYSSSHPDASMQGPLSVELKPGGVLGTGTRFDVSGEVAGFPEGSDRMGLVTVKAGIPVVQPGTTTPKPTPTHEITTFQMAKFTVVQDGTRYVTVGDRPSSFAVPALERALLEHFTPRLFALSGGSPLDDARPLFDTMAAQVQSASGAAANGVTLEFPTIKNGEVAATTLAEVCNGDDDDRRAVLARAMALVLAQGASKALMVRQGKGEDDVVLAKAWAGCWPRYSSPKGRSSGRKPAVVQQQVTSEHYVPVFPVSDARGYEVVGTYRYGRGLTIEAGGSFQELSATADDGTVNYDEIEEVLGRIKGGAAVTDALLGVTPATAARFATSAGEAITGDTQDGQKLQGTAAGAEGSNLPSSASEFTQKVSIVNAAYNLADLSSQANERDVCACRGAEADLLIQAFNAELYTDVDDGDKVQNWLADTVAAQAPSWLARKAAYAGEILDTQRQGLTSAVTSAVSTFAGLGRGTGDVRSAADDILAAGEDLADDLAAVPDAARTDVDSAFSFFNDRSQR